MNRREERGPGVDKQMGGIQGVLSMVSVSAQHPHTQDSSIRPGRAAVTVVPGPPPLFHRGPAQLELGAVPRQGAPRDDKPVPSHEMTLPEPRTEGSRDSIRLD